MQVAFNGLISGAVVALSALGITLIFGIQRFSNVAHADLITVGAYLAYALVTLGVGMLWGVAGAVILTVLVGGVSYLIIFRPLASRSPVTLVIASIGVALVMRHVVALAFGAEVRGFPVEAQRAVSLYVAKATPIEIGIVLVALLAMALLWVVLRRTRLGLEMRAVADVRDLAAVSGISSEKVALWTWAIASVLACIAGVAIGLRGSITPLMGWSFLLPSFAAAILGGIGNPIGAIVGGFILGVSQELATFVLPSSYKPVIAFLVLGLVLLVRPSGIFGVRQRV